MSASTDAWSDFNVAMIGGAAALDGLVIVAASVNIRQIVKSRLLTSRLASGVVGLVLVIAVSALGLVPGLFEVAHGIGASLAALAAGGFAVRAAQAVFAERDPVARFQTSRALVGFLAPLAYLVGGVLLTVGAGAGQVLFAVGAVSAVIAATLTSWVAMVEVLRQPSEQ